jgi:5'-3' exonuclease
MKQLSMDKKMVLDEGLIRHMVLNSLRSYSRQFKQQYGDLVVCCDSRHSWRKQWFPFYKSHRKKDRDSSAHDWTLIFQTLDKIKTELKTYFPYKVVEVDRAEADDVIAVLTKYFPDNEKILILSSDKDFVQLQYLPNVTQYSPILKKYIKTDDPLKYVKEHIIKGDKSDGIPNFLSPDNTFAVGERQKTINTKKLTEWINQEPEQFCTTVEMKVRWKRNQILIDLNFVPGDIATEIIRTYEEAPVNSRQSMFNYFVANRLTNLIGVIDEF